MNIAGFIIIFCLLILVYACQSDIRKRNVSNIPWIVMAAAGVVLLVPGVITSGVSLLIQAAVSVAVTLAVTYLFFRFGLFGAADAKCLISMAILFPASPSLVIMSRRLPLFSPGAPDIFPFALTTLMDATILALLVPLSLCLRNLPELGFSGFFRHLRMVFTSYQLPIAQLVKKKHVRLAQPYPDEGGKPERKPVFGGMEIDDEMIGRLESYHREGKIGSKVWVTPELPFIVFITGGFLIAVIVGNLVFALAIRG